MKLTTFLVGLFLLPCKAFLPQQLHESIIKSGLHHSAPHITTFSDDIQRAFGKKVVIDLSYMLPKLDIGHDILAADHKLILDLFTYDDYIPHLGIADNSDSNIFSESGRRSTNWPGLKSFNGYIG